MTDENFKITLQILQVLNPKFHSNSVLELCEGWLQYIASVMQGFSHWKITAVKSAIPICQTLWQWEIWRMEEQLGEKMIFAEKKIIIFLEHFMPHSLIKFSMKYNGDPSQCLWYCFDVLLCLTGTAIYPNGLNFLMAECHWGKRAWNGPAWQCMLNARV